MPRTLKLGDTYPPLRGQASDETGSPLNLSLAASLAIRMVSPGHTITGACIAIQPPLADADGVHQWNWQYNWVAGDTANAGVYTVELIVTWDAGPPVHIETFPNSGSETLTIEPS